MVASANPHSRSLHQYDARPISDLNMAFELLLSALVTVLCLVLAWSARRSFVSVHLLPLGLLCTALPLVRIVFGGSPWRASDETIAFAYGSIALYALCIWLGAKALRDKSLARFAAWIASVDRNELPTAQAVWVISALWLTRLYQAAEYGVLVSGSATEEAIRSMPYWLTSFNSILVLVGMGSTVVLALAASRGSTKLWILVLLELTWTFVSEGRRQFLFLALLLLWIARRAMALRARTLIIGAALSVVLLYVLTPVFLYGREYNQTLLAAGLSPVAAFLSAFSQSWNECGVTLACSDRAGVNVVERGNAMEFLKLIVGAERQGSDYLLGLGFLYSLVWAIPGFLIRKPDLMTEQYLQVHFALPLQDDAISIPALAYADFGILGCAFAGITLSIYVYYVAAYARHRHQLLVFASIAMGVLTTLWNIEGDPISYVIVIRDSFIVLAVATITASLYRIVRRGRIQ